MAIYRYSSYLQQLNDDAFEPNHSPGSAAPYAGIYRCMGCGREIGIAEGHTLPAQNHHEHTSDQGSIRWRLIVYADHRPK